MGKLEKASFRSTALEMLSTGIIGNHATSRLVDRIAELLACEAIQVLGQEALISEAYASGLPGFDQNVLAHNTVAELVRKYAQVCGALQCAGEHAIEFYSNEYSPAVPVVDENGHALQEEVSAQINRWLTESQQRIMLAETTAERPN